MNTDESSGITSGGRSSPRPYIRLDGILNERMEKFEGDTVKMKCQAIGSPLPIRFSWLKNGAPLEFDRKRRKRIRVRDRDYLSKLTITSLQILDSGYYKCIAENIAGFVNTTGLLKVKSKPSNGHPISPNTNMKNKPQSGHIGVFDYGDLSGMPSNPSDQYNALPNAYDEQWLDQGLLPGQKRTLINNTCISYGGTACGKFLNGLSILIVHPEIENMKDIERNLIATNLFINKHPEITDSCKSVSMKVGCFHKYHVCNPSTSSDIQPVMEFAQQRTSQRPESPSVMRMCKSDCENLRDRLCPKEYMLAARHNLIGNDEDDLLPDCDTLTNDRCLSLTNKESSDNFDVARVQPTHMCYVGAGTTYRGTAASTIDGQRCLPWSQTDLPSISSHPISSVNHNYCRNANNRPKPWCVGERSKRVEPCAVVKCADGMFPELAAKEHNLFTVPFDSVTPPSTHDIPHNHNNDNSVSLFWDNIKSTWNSYPATQQYAAMGGLAGLLLLLLLCICCCCCSKSRRKRRQMKKRQQQVNGGIVGLKNNGNGPLLNGGDNSAANIFIDSSRNGHIYRKLDGSAYSGSATGPHHHQAAMELTPFLPPPPTSLPPAPAPPTFISTIAQENIQFLEPLGEGQFGKVWKGEMNSNAIKQPVQVAIKTVKEDASPRMIEDFDRELEFAATLSHPNIVGLLGVCYTQPKCAVFEYMVHGDLHDFLLLRSPYIVNDKGETNVDRDRMSLDQEDFLNIATQIAAGMQYLASRHYVHRDLATRNCLLTDRMVVKISDFGLMRDIYAADYYMMQTRTMLPVRWMPPEAIVYGQFAESSDVWAYGTTLWEIYSYGAQPYFGYTNEQVIELIRNRCLLECPQHCPPRMYSVMVECWHEQPSNRPTFNTLHNRMQHWSKSINSPAQSSAYMSQQHRPASVNSGATSSAHGHNINKAQSGSRHSSSGTNTNNSRAPPTYGNMPPPYHNMNNNSKLLQQNTTQSPLISVNGKDSPRMGRQSQPNNGPLQPLRPTGYPDYEDSEDESSEA